VLKTLAGLIAELRAVGVPVSPTEHIDAASALAHTAVGDRPALRAALATTLVKNAGHLATFNTVFDLYFSGRRAGRDSSSTVDEPDAEGDSEGGGGGGMLGGASDAELAELLYRAIRDGDQLMMKAIAAQLVTRHSGFEPGRRVAGVYYQARTLRSVDLEGILARLREETAEAAATPLDRMRLNQMYAARVENFRSIIQWEIRERLVADRGPEDVARTLRRPLPEDIDFLSATGRDAVAIRDALKPLARKLAARLARKRRSRHTAALDFRRTMRRSLSTGGTPVELVFRRPHPSRPELVVLADVSGSVATFAGFTLSLVYALRSEFARVRTFVFIDAIEDVTEMMEKAENVAEVTHRINQGTTIARVYGGSDYGNALRLFAENHLEKVRRTSTVLVLGDARNNYLAPRDECLAAVAERARGLYWLNPEPISNWNEGDSIIRRYGPHCDGVYECRNIRQLKAFVEQLD
jgi:uncharacterized protein with von Willebrand factor type A (vWA) domain